MLPNAHWLTAANAVSKQADMQGRANKAGRRWIQSFAQTADVYPLSRPSLQ